MLYSGLALLVLLACYYGSRPQGIHLTRAELLVQDTLGYPPPSRTQDWRTLPNQWQQVPLPHAPRPRVVPGAGDGGLLPTRTSWFHFSLGPAQAVPPHSYIYIPRWKTDGELAIYVDGRLFYQTHANLQWNGSNRPLWIPLEEAAETTPPKDILIRIRHVRGIGGALSTLWIGDYRQLAPAYYMRAFFQAELPYISSALFLATGVFAFLIWLRARRETLYLYYAVMTLVTFLRVMHAYMGADRLPISDAWFGWITVNSVGWAVLIIHLFLTALHHHHVRVLTWIIALMCVGFGGITLPLFEGTTDATIISPLMYLTMVSVGAVTFALHIAWSRRAGTLEGAGLAICGLLSFLLGARDMLLQNNIIDIESLFVSFYAQIALIIAFSQIMLSRYLRAMKAVGEANVVLARSLAEREAQLNASHLKLREIERREVLFQERQRLMQDMHDGLGSSLVSALRVVEHGHIDEAEIAQLLKTCIDDLKLTIDSMEPVETDLLLLLGTLRFRLQPRLEATGIRLRWEVRDVPPLGWLDQRHSLHILRILQEAFTNVIKHAGASEIVVTTSVRDGCVRVGVGDNGKGFDARSTAQGRGLGNQARRAEVIGGRIELESTPEGTRFTLLLPVEGAGAKAC
ncbi:ATP-binding protein [Sphingomonas sp. KR3-1]|uniref:sensor histidine kinase n=1 Tax=Sphingomonas sp. KR3-1 TaxID=3156611 RepID=UPI0032B60B9B